MKRFAPCSNSILPLVAILAALFAHVDVATKALWRRLGRIRHAHDYGLDWLTAVRISRVGVLSGGATLSEGKHTAEFLVSEANGTLSRTTGTVTVEDATTLVAGQVLEIAAGKYIALATPANAAAILYQELKNDTVAPVDMAGVVIDRYAEVRLADLVGVAGVAPTAPALAALLALGIKAR